MAKFNDIFRVHLSRFVLGALALLIAVLWWFKQQESNFIPPEPPAPAAVQVQDYFPNESSERVESSFNLPAAEEQKWLRVIQQFDVFDAQIIRGKDDFEQRAGARYVEAQRAFDQGDFEQAKDIAEDILFNIWPSHLAAKELLAKIEAKEKEAEAALATPAAEIPPADAATPVEETGTPGPV